ncbi:interaptin [Drosophila takahashii]|uniref:interaptin n=1 Tax=Drosophila takahashii TaxID=29030 RepID=UPI0038994288
MNTLSKPEKELIAVAPIVRVKNPDEIKKQINSEICDEYECNLLRIELEIMNADYDNWEGIFKETLLRVRPEIIMWEKAMEIVLKLLEDSEVEADVNNDGKGFYVTVSYKPTEFVHIKVNNKDDPRCFTLLKALDWIQQKLIDLKTSVRKIENDQQYVTAQREKINSIETCLMKKEVFLAHQRITIGKINEKKDNLLEESDPLSETRKDFETEFKEFMSEVEKDNALLNHMTDDILLLLKKLSTLRSENLTDAIVNGVRKEINELLARLGENKSQDKSTNSAETSTNIHLTQNYCIQIDSTENDSIKIEIGLEKKEEKSAADSIENDSTETELNEKNSVKICSTKNVSISIDSSKKDCFHTGSKQCDIEITQDQSATKLNQECKTKSKDDNNKIQLLGINQYDDNSLEDLTDRLSQCSLEQTEKADSSDSDFLKSLSIKNDWNKIDFTKKFLKSKADKKVQNKRINERRTDKNCKALPESSLNNAGNEHLYDATSNDLNEPVDNFIQGMEDHLSMRKIEYTENNGCLTKSSSKNIRNLNDFNLEIDSHRENLEEPIPDMPVANNFYIYRDESLEESYIPLSEIKQQYLQESDEYSSINEDRISINFLKELNSMDHNPEEPVPDTPVTYDLNKHIDDSLEEITQQSEKEPDECSSVNEETSSTDFLSELNSIDKSLKIDSRLENLEKPVPDMPVAFDLYKHIDDSPEQILFPLPDMEQQSEKESDEYSSINEKSKSENILKEIDYINVKLETNRRLENLKEPISDMSHSNNLYKYIDESLDEITIPLPKIKQQPEIEWDEYSSINEETSSTNFLNELNSMDNNLKIDSRLENLEEYLPDMPVTYDLNKYIADSLEQITLPLTDIKQQTEKESHKYTSINEESSSIIDSRLENLEEPVPDMPVTYDLNKYIEDSLDQITFSLPDLKQQSGEESNGFAPTTEEKMDGDITLVNNCNNNGSLSMDEVFKSFESNEYQDNSDGESI